MTPTTPLFFFAVPLFVATLLQGIVQFYVLLIIVWAVLSWFNRGRGLVSDIYDILDKIVSPYINLFRRFIPPLGGLDISPLVAIIVLQILVRVLFFWL
jgi:YggT family protein